MADAPAPSARQPQVPLRWIDVHCHVFNAADLPMRQFIERTRLNLEKFPLVRLGVAIAVAGVIGAAWTAAEEAEAIGQVGAQAEHTPSTLEMLQRATNSPEGMDLLRAAVSHVDGVAPPADERVTSADLARVAAHIDTGIDGLAAARWGDAFKRRRSVIIDDLLSQFDSGDSVLLTPSLVDYNRWLGIKSGSSAEAAISPLADQLRVMAALAAHVAVARYKLLCAYAPFDPWRYLEDEQAGRKTILDEATPHVAGGGLIGFKVYPPMGFAPSGNRDRQDDDFPPELQAAFGPGVGAALDHAMDRLFQYCLQHDLAIQAHCADSNFPRDDGNPERRAMYAAPEYWEQVLRKPGYESLRLNLGHFGGVWSFAASQREDASDSDRQEEERARAWASGIAVLMDHYPNVYADLSFADTLLRDPRDAEASGTRDYLSALMTAHPVLKERLMYGSDWVMVGYARFGDNYARTLLAHVKDLFPDMHMEAFRWRNAARFLGLAPGEKLHQRLSSFLQRVGADPALLTRFDPNPQV